jgi:hypothetical protein
MFIDFFTHFFVIIYRFPWPFTRVFHFSLVNPITFYRFFYPAFHADPLTDNRIRVILTWCLNLYSYQKTGRPESAGTKCPVKKGPREKFLTPQCLGYMVSQKAQFILSLIFEDLEQTVLI